MSDESRNNQLKDARNCKKKKNVLEILITGNYKD
jgi:hypothetical protein